MKKREFNVAIIGGGASGLAAAVELRMSSPELSVLIIEKMKEPGRKLRATGSGRCNISNTGAAGYDRIMEFFSEIGLSTRTYENGLVYPYSESASDVADLLTDRAKKLGVEIACGEEVLKIKRDSSFEIESVTKDAKGEHKIITKADYVILATGGKAGPGYGTTGDGYRMAKELGHSMTATVPALTGIECAEWSDDAKPDAHVLAGTRIRAIASLYKNGEEIFSENGEVQFTRYGLSGICIFNMSRFMRLDKSKGESMADFSIRLNLTPDFDVAEYFKIMKRGPFANTTARDMLRGILKEPAANYIAERASNDTDEIAALVKELEFHPVNLRGWKDAQVTSGGVSLAEIDEASSESKIVPGLYITGELADRDYPCGGFNLSNAWITGLAAADDISAKTKGE